MPSTGFSSDHIQGGTPWATEYLHFTKELQITVPSNFVQSQAHLEYLFPYASPGLPTADVVRLYFPYG